MAFVYFCRQHTARSEVQCTQVLYYGVSGSPLLTREADEAHALMVNQCQQSEQMLRVWVIDERSVAEGEGSAV